jgi:hypothetical protein
MGERRANNLTMMWWVPFLLFLLNTVLLEKQMVTQPVKRCPEGSLPCLHEPTTGPYPEPHECSPLFSHYFSKTHSNINLPSHWRLSLISDLFILVFNLFRTHFFSLKYVLQDCLPHPLELHGLRIKSSGLFRFSISLSLIWSPWYNI